LDACRNTTSPIHLIDTVVYPTANAVVCQVACPCFANSSLWNETTVTSSSTEEDTSVSSLLTDAQTSAATITMLDNSEMSHNYQDCDLTTAVFNVTDELLKNITENVKFGMAALGGVEADFGCAGMCASSNLYSFSEVSNGPPTTNCSIGVTTFISEVSSSTQKWFWTFATLTLLCGAYLSFFWSEKHNKLESPLLGK